MKRKFTLLIAALALLTMIVQPGRAWGQSDYSTNYTGNITLSTTGGTSASACAINISGTSYNGIKAGTNKVAGAVQITVPANTKYLHIHAAAWNNENVTLTVAPTGYTEDIALTSNSGISGNSPFTFSGDPSTSSYYKVITFTDALAADTDLTFTATGGKRFVVWGVTSEEGGGSTLLDNDLALTGAPIELTFDLYNNNDAQVINYTTSSTGAVTIAANNYVETVVNGDDKTITVTPVSVTNGAKTITVNQAADNTYKAGLTTFTVNITDSTPYAGGDVTFVAGTDTGTSTGQNPDQITKSGVTVSSTSAALAAAQYRFYKNSTTTISTASGKITKIVFTQCDSSYPISNLTNLDNGTWTGEATSVSFVASSGQARASQIVVTVTTTSDPYITASDVNIAYDATSGQIEYTIGNPDDDATLEAVVADGATIANFTLGTIGTSSIAFTCDANTDNTARTATVTLNYTKNSAILATKDVTITQDAAPVIYNTIEAIFNAATTTEKYVTVNFDGWVVTGINGSQAFVSDGTNGLIIYQSNHAFEAGNTLTGTVDCSLVLYYGSAELKGVTATMAGLTVGTGGTVTPQVVTADQMTNGIKTGAVVTFEDLAYNGTNFSDGTNNITVRTNMYDYSNDVQAGKTYNITGVYEHTLRIYPRDENDIEEVIIITPVITVDPTTADPFSYHEGNGPSDEQWFEISGTNLTSTNVTAIVTTGADYFEVSNDDDIYADAVTTNIDDMEYIIIRMKAGLDASNYEGAVTLTNEGAEPVVITLAGTVLSNATYDVTCAVTPTEAAIMEADPVSAHEGETVTLTYAAETGYSLTSIVITKTEGGSATGIVPTAGANDSYTFTMPAYDVTATATFVSDIFTGSFVQFTGDFVEGDYILVYNGGAMNNDNTTTSNKLRKTDVTPSEGIITDPSSDIVWHIAPSATDGYWTIYNAKVGKYVNGAATNSTNVTLVDNPSYSYGAQWYVTKGTGDNLNKYDFGSKSTESQSTKRFLRRNGDVFGHYAASNGGYLTLYKYTNLIEHTITFNGNGGTYMSEDTYTQKVYEGIETALDANKFEKANSAFVGWSTTIDGDVEYADQALITVTADKELYAKWSTAYTAMVDSQILGGSVLIDDGQQGTDIIEAAEGTEISLIYTAEIGYAFNAWNVYNADDPTITVAVENNKFNMPAYDVIISATFVETTDIIYSLITSIDDLEPGAHYLIASEVILDKVYIMSEQGGNNRTAEEVTVNNNIITFPEAIYYDFVICGDGTNKWTIYDEQKPGYLYAASSSSNQLKTRDANSDGNSVWNIEFDNGNLSIVAQGGNTRNTMQFNSGNSLFACYASASQSPVYLYKKYKDNNHNFYSNTKLESVTIAATENYIVHNSATLEATQSLTNEGNATNLIILDGGQLIVDDPVAASVEKNIAKPTTWDPESTSSDGWYTISSPVGNVEISNINGLQADPAPVPQYDLYSYDEEHVTWYNSQGTEHEFTELIAGMGYLYAKNNNDTVTFAGDVNVAPVTLTLTHHGNSSLSGCNLIGNPFAQNITMDNISGIDLTGGYVLTNAGGWKSEVDTEIKPCQGFLVKVDNETVITINRVPQNTNKSRANRDYIAFTVANSQYEDVTYAMFSKGSGLDKINHRNDQIPMVYIQQDDKNYAIATMSDNTEMFNLNFKAMTTGKYTLSYKAQGTYSYLHVIDRFTGEDIDMLVEGEYSFIGSSYDNDARFIVKLSYNANIDEFDTNSIFAYQNGDEIIVNGEGQLQVYDVMGRFVQCINVNGTESISASQFSDAVYIFRMIGETVKTQKIVVR